jgi:hypothetical protein
LSILGDTNVLYTISLYTHDQYTAQPPAALVDDWIKAVLIRAITEGGGV